MPNKEEIKGSWEEMVNRLNADTKLAETLASIDSMIKGSHLEEVRPRLRIPYVTASSITENRYPWIE
jgi:hypothetical protein